MIPCEAAKVEDAWVYAAQPKVRRAGELAEIALEGLAGLLYTDREGQLRSCNATWSETWEFPAAQEVQIQGRLHGAMSIQTITGPEQVEIRPEMMVEALAISDQQQTMVTGLELGQVHAADPDRPSLILCRAGKSGLWALAKASGSTVEAIRTANSLTDDPAEERLLLIPVC